MKLTWKGRRSSSFQKTESLCPICHKPRGKGTKTELSHGPCAEAMAKEASQGKDESRKQREFKNQGAKYKQGELPDWMFT